MIHLHIREDKSHYQISLLFSTKNIYIFRVFTGYYLYYILFIVLLWVQNLSQSTYKLEEILCKLWLIGFDLTGIS